jgi:hypothetical protein
VQLEDDLAEFMLGDDEYDTADDYEIVEAPRGIEEADRTLRRLRRVEASIAAVDELADAEAARIEAWRLDRTSGQRRYAQSLRDSIIDWTIAAELTKTVNTPSGKIFIGAPKQGTTEIENKDKLLAWAREHAPDIIETEEKVPASKVKALLDGDYAISPDGILVDANGEPVPGVVIKGRGDRNREVKL